MDSQEKSDIYNASEDRRLSEQAASAGEVTVLLKQLAGEQGLARPETAKKRWRAIRVLLYDKLKRRTADESR